MCFSLTGSKWISFMFIWNRCDSVLCIVCLSHSVSEVIKGTNSFHFCVSSNQTVDWRIRCLPNGRVWVGGTGHGTNHLRTELSVISACSQGYSHPKRLAIFPNAPGHSQGLWLGNLPQGKFLQSRTPELEVLISCKASNNICELYSVKWFVFSQLAVMISLSSLLRLIFYIDAVLLVSIVLCGEFLLVVYLTWDLALKEIAPK